MAQFQVVKRVGESQATYPAVSKVASIALAHHVEQKTQSPLSKPVKVRRYRSTRLVRYYSRLTPALAYRWSSLGFLSRLGSSFFFVLRIVVARFCTEVCLEDHSYGVLNGIQCCARVSLKRFTGAKAPSRRLLRMDWRVSLTPSVTKGFPFRFVSG